MPLIINGLVVDKLPSDTRTLFELYPTLKDYARPLLAQPHKVISPLASLYVLQREYAVVSPDDKFISIVGSDNVTTCSIVVLRHSRSGVVGFGHFDGSGRDEGIEDMIRKVRLFSSSLDIHGNLELHLIGGFIDRKGYSEDLAMGLLCGFHRQPINIHLITANICEVNNILQGNVNHPVIHGAAINVKTGDIFPATFLDQGPDIPLRSSRFFSPGSREMLDVYDTQGGLLRIGPFNYQPVRSIDLWLKEGDDIILQHLSTSPEAEGADFVSSVRQTLLFIHKNPFPSVTIFADNRPRCYRKDEYGNWIRL